MSIERISEIEGLPVVGKYYLVPSAKSVRYGYPEWWPIIGAAHSDKDYLNFPHEHYHFDFRFVAKTKYVRRFHSPVNSLAMGTVLLLLSKSIVGCEIERVVELAERKWKCVRQMLTFPDILCKVLEPAYKEQTLNLGCLRCPHRGLPLNGLPVDAENNVICPGHGLRFNLTTGKLVSRLNQDVRGRS